MLSVFPCMFGFFVLFFGFGHLYVFFEEMSRSSDHFSIEIFFNILRSVLRFIKRFHLGINITVLNYSSFMFEYLIAFLFRKFLRNSRVLILSVHFILSFFCLFRATPVACGSSQARKWNKGWNWSCSCQPTPQPQQRWILNLLSKARNWTRILMDPSRVHYFWAMKRTPHLYKFFKRSLKTRLSIHGLVIIQW